MLQFYAEAASISNKSDQETLVLVKTTDPKRQKENVAALKAMDMHGVSVQHANTLNRYQGTIIITACHWSLAH
jgi:hypothetical protein